MFIEQQQIDVFVLRVLLCLGRRGERKSRRQSGKQAKQQGKGHRSSPNRQEKPRQRSFRVHELYEDPQLSLVQSGEGIPVVHGKTGFQVPDCCRALFQVGPRTWVNAGKGPALPRGVSPGDGFIIEGPLPAPNNGVEPDPGTSKLPYDLDGVGLHVMGVPIGVVVAHSHAEITDDRGYAKRAVHPEGRSGCVK